jgi:hypothetical protein
MNHDEIRANLRCFIELSCFDAFTGEEFDKSRLEPAHQKEVTACEEAIRFLDGASLDDLQMSKGDIITTLKQLADDFENGIAEAEAHGVDKSLERGNITAFRAMAEIIEQYLGREPDAPEIDRNSKYISVEDDTLNEDDLDYALDTDDLEL